MIEIYLYTFENGPLDIKILVANIKSTILKKQKKVGKAERTEKKQNFSAKSRRGGSSAEDTTTSCLKTKEVRDINLISTEK